MRGEVHAENAAPSSEHSKLEPCSLAEKPNVAPVLAVTAGGAPDPIVVCGAVVSTVHVRLAGVCSTFPAASVARIRISCWPTVRPVYSLGELHAVKAAPSSEHSNVAPASPAEKVNVALVLWVLAPGPSSIVVFGAAVSTIQVYVAGVGSVCEAPSTAWTRRVCCPSASPPTECGERHSANAAPSSEHSNVTPGSFAEKVNRASALWVTGSGPVAMEVSGGSSTVQSYSAGESSSMPCAFRVRTNRVWSPSGTLVYSCGEEQTRKGPPSSAHSKVEPDWVDENVNPAVVLAVPDSGPLSMVVSGRSTTVQSCGAGESSRLPDASIAATRKL